MISLIFILFYTLPVCVIALLEISHIKRQNEVVILNERDFFIAKDYAIIKQYFEITSAILGGILFVFWVNLGFPVLYNAILGFSGDGFWTQILFVIAFLAINFLISLPLESYKTLIIDKSFGFTKSTPKLYALDSLKELVLMLIVAFFISLILVYLIENFALWWILGFFVVLIVAILANIIYPTIIAPLFNKFTPLEDSALKAQITDIMTKVGFRANGIFVMDASKRDGRLNAYFGGLGKSKRVVLFDTLLQKVAPNELLAILGHELAHFKHKDLLKNIFIMAGVLFVLFFIAGNLPQEIFKTPKNGGSTICMLILISSLIGFYFMPIINFFSRRAEYAADKFGSELTDKKDLGNALIKLINENKAFPYSHKIFVFFYMSHPPLLERLKELGFKF